MPSTSNWSNQIISKIKVLKDRFGQKEYRDLQLDFLSSLAQRVGQFSSDCAQCITFRQDIDKLMANIDDVIQSDDEGLWESYIRDAKKSVNNITEHLVRQHNLVTDGQYMLRYAGIGGSIMTIFTILTFFSHNTWLIKHFWPSIGVGAGVGVIVGAILEQKAQKEGRILRTEVNEKPSSFWIRLFFGALVFAVCLAIAAFMPR